VGELEDFKDKPPEHMGEADRTLYDRALAAYDDARAAGASEIRAGEAADAVIREGLASRG
jgi:hypothetical protein